MHRMKLKVMGNLKVIALTGLTTKDTAVIP